MASMSRFPRWQRNTLIALAFLSVFVAYISFGYPQVWRQVRPGMTVAEVDALCGPPDSFNGMAKPDMWIVTQPFGKWELRVSPHEDTGDRKTDAVKYAEVHYLPFWNEAWHIVIRKMQN